MQEWSVDEVCRWLKSLDMDQKVINCFREQKISGDILVTLTKEVIFEFGPDIVFGDRIKLIKLRDNELTKEIKNPCTTSSNDSSEFEDAGCSKEIFVSTSFRNFGRKTDSAIPVTQYTHFQSESKAVDNLIEPVHRYFGAQNLDSVAVKHQFSLEIIPFICACLNDRTNGTFHLGVNKDGKIQGIIANMDDFQKLLSKLIEECFSPDQLDAVKNCVRPVRLVKVVQNAHNDMPQEADKLHLVEVDVVSSHCLCTDQAFFAKALKPNSTKPGCREFERTKVFRFQNEFEPLPISDKTLAQFMESKSSLAKRRQEAEQEHMNPKSKLQTSDLGKKLIRLLCPGGNSLNDDDVYPIFVMSSAPSLQSNAEDFIANTRFINSVERKAVFDFDDASIPTSVYRNHAHEGRVPSQVFVVPSSEAAARNKQDVGFVTLLQECLSSGSACQPWIFCNGSADTKDKAMNVLEWNHARRSDFLMALDLLHESIPRGRSLVVFLLFSEEYKVLLSVAKEFCLKFKGNWIMICDTPEVAAKFKDYLINTAEVVADEKEFNRHSVVGMPWLHVNQAISGIAGDLTTGEISIPTSSGTPIGISRELLNELQDIEVISSNHLDCVTIDEDALDNLNLEKEQSFYHGKEVDWWNFWFKSHVLERDKLKEILSWTRGVLDGKDDQETDEHVGVVVISHQPGSGATTLAKNILWELKTEYRCATLRTFTNDTANQLRQLLKYGEPTSHPKPVLLLVDNFEKVHELKESLESEARKLAGEIRNRPTVAFVLLVVSRCSSSEEAVFSREKSLPQFFLIHCLSTVELQLFSRKFDDMESDQKKRKRLDPRFLLSFNILRNNFSEDYIKTTVTELIKLVTDPRERKLLEYVALVGVYDPDNNSIPASCFDRLMCQGTPGTTWVAGTSINSAWLNKMSSYLKILVNDDSRNGIKLRMKGIRVIHSSLAQEIYTVLAGNRLVSEVCLEFLKSDVFSSLNCLDSDLHRIINSITVKRVKRADGKCQTDFSLLVQKIRESPGDDTTKIVEILELAFDMTDNVYIAQHLARYFISLKDWEMAEQWAKIATEREPNKEALWNTYAHVFSDQFYQRFKDGPVNAETVEASLELAVKAMNKYQHEQYVNDREIGNNPTGLLYEGGTVVNLIELFERIPGLEDREIRRFLVTSCVPKCLKTWNESSLQIVKALKDRAARIQAELEEDKYRQEKDRASASVMPYEAKRLNERMIKLTESFDNYFGVESNETPKYFSPEEAAAYRRSRIFRLKGNTFSRILEHCRMKNVQQLQIIHSLAEHNVKSSYRSATDLQTFIGVSMAQFFLSEDARIGEDRRLLRRLTKLCQDLMRMDASSNNNYTPLEPYVFFALLNWPTASSSKYQEQDVNQIEVVLPKWKHAYEVQNPVPTGKPQNSKRPRKILFFLGNSSGMNRIVPWNKKSSASLETLEGTLMNGGREVKLVIKTENREYCIDIETAGIENNRIRWNKKIFFELGFTWAGPVACIVIEDSRRMQNQSVDWTQVNAIDGVACPESPSGFYTQGTLLERPRVMNPYLRQHSRPDDNLSRAPGATWHPRQFQDMHPLLVTPSQPFPRGSMPRTPEAAFNFSRNELFLRAPSTYFDQQQEAAEFHDGWQTTGRGRAGLPRPKRSDQSF